MGVLMFEKCWLCGSPMLGQAGCPDYYIEQDDTTTSVCSNPECGVMYRFAPCNESEKGEYPYHNVPLRALPLIKQNFPVTIKTLQEKIKRDAEKKREEKPTKWLCPNCNHPLSWESDSNRTDTIEMGDFSKAKQKYDNDRKTILHLAFAERVLRILISETKPSDVGRIKQFEAEIISVQEQIHDKILDHVDPDDCAAVSYYHCPMCGGTLDIIQPLEQEKEKKRFEKTFRTKEHDIIDSYTYGPI